VSERTGVWSILSNPWVYEGFHHLIGARRWLCQFADGVIRAGAGTCVLDIGCGPGALLRYLPTATYIGLDRNKDYIDRAKRVFGGRGTFICDDVANFAKYSLPQVDVAVAIGLLHHLDDSLAIDMLRATKATLKPEGRLITVDPCYHPRQSAIQRFVVGSDRGIFVRRFTDYQALCSRVFGEVTADWQGRHLPFPASMCVLQAKAW
jgi:SAM-dependent methyltransferase